MRITVHLRGHLYRYSGYRTRQVDLPHRCPTVRDLLDLVDVPVHEIGVVCVNGRATGLDAYLSEDDAVDITPTLLGG